MENQNFNKDSQAQLQSKIQEILYQIDLLKKQNESIETQIAILNQVIKQTNSQIASLEGLKEIRGKDKKEIMISIGDKIFIKVQLSSSNVLFNIGRKIFIEKSYEDVEKLLRDDVVKFTKTLNELNKKNDEISNKIEQLTILGQNIAAKLQSK